MLYIIHTNTNYIILQCKISVHIPGTNINHITIQRATHYNTNDDYYNNKNNNNY